MVERRPVKTLPIRATVTPLRPPTTAGSSNSGVWVALLVGGSVIFAVGHFASPSTTSPAATSSPVNAVGNAQQALVTAVAAQTPPAPQKLSPAGVRRGASRVSLASAEGVAGEMIYSQNCYDAVGRKFAWQKLDECGGFDTETALAMSDAPADPQTDVAWFQSEAAAGRYLKAATAAGLETGAADQRLASLQAQVNRRHKRTEPKFLPVEAEGGAVQPGSVAVINTM